MPVSSIQSRILTEAPNIPACPIPQETLLSLARLAEGLSPSALQWLSGYLAGVAVQMHDVPTASVATVPADSSHCLSIVYGSQTGNAKRLAERLAQRVEAAGFSVRLFRADTYPLRELKRERLLYLVISTQGEGEPPDDARGFVEYLVSRRAPALSGLKYAVLGLGDSSYPEFCVIGQQLDARLAELGATRWLERGDADADIESVAAPWLENAFGKVGTELKTSTVAPLATVTPLRPQPAAWSREKPFAGEVLLNQPIVADGSSVDVHHIELSLAGSGLSYEPGDALGVWPRQSKLLIEAVLNSLNTSGDIEVAHGGEHLPLGSWLGERRELTRLSRAFLAAHIERSGVSELKTLLAPESRAQLAQFLDAHQLIDLLRRYPADWDAQALVTALAPLAPRLYSIASSREVAEDEVHLTVAHLRYQRDGESRFGVASQYLAGASEGAHIPLFIEANERFRLPADPARDIIMIGPGVGVAPFRGFVQERAVTGARGRNWLFFGHRQRRTDFLYQLEWQAALRNGTLSRLEVAFSRDQQHKLYVQHRLLEQGRELYAWLSEGAHLYVCGDAKHMARDVHNALLEIGIRHGGKTRDAAGAWLNELLTTGRYARDVY